MEPPLQGDYLMITSQLVSHAHIAVATSEADHSGDSRTPRNSIIQLSTLLSKAVVVITYVNKMKHAIL